MEYSAVEYSVLVDMSVQCSALVDKSVHCNTVHYWTCHCSAAREDDPVILDPYTITPPTPPHPAQSATLVNRPDQLPGLDP